jgi:agmatinase
MLQLVIQDIMKAGKIVITIGGEHTITYGIAKGFGKKAAETVIVSFDAHLDLRDEYSGLRMSHTTFMRRTNEDVKPARIFLTTQNIRKEGNDRIGRQLKEKLEEYKSIYLSVDMDILDPAFVPAVQNPEGDGLEMHSLLDILHNICDKRVVGFDVLEIAPDYDRGVSAVQAARVIFEIVCSIEKSRKSKL